MKKFIAFMVMAIMVIIPLNVHAATGINYKCGEADSDGNITCTVTYNVDTSAETLTVTLTEQGGADVSAINLASGSDWTISSSNEVNGVWTVILTSPGVSGEGDLFTFTYKASGEEDCKIVLALGENKVDITPTTPSTPDKPEENKQTGSTLPYIALGAVVLIATGAYLATRNKSTMYRL